MKEKKNRQKFEHNPPRPTGHPGAHTGKNNNSNIIVFFQCRNFLVGNLIQHS